MNLRLLHILLFCLFTSCISCKSQSLTSNNTINSSLPEIVLDTILKNVNINDSFFDIIVQRDKYDENFKVFTKDENNYELFSFFQSPVTISIKDIKGQNVIFHKKIVPDFDDYPFINLEFKKATKNKSDEGNLFLNLSKHYGGSSANESLYFISLIENKIVFKKLENFKSELSYFVETESGDAVYILTGIWEKDENETHFGVHRYQITKYYLNGENKGQSTEPQVTSYKYALPEKYADAVKTLELIKNNDPDIKFE